MKKVLPLFILSFLLIDEAHAQVTRYLVKLRNKGATTFTLANPSPYLSARAINRRTRYGIAIDSSDLPVPASYLNQIRSIPNVTILNVSKWQNSVSIQISDPVALTAINALPFVQSTSDAAARTGNNANGKYQRDIAIAPYDPSSARVDGIEADYFNYGTGSYNEIHVHKGEFLHNIGLRGQGMQMAVLDAGFTNYATLRAFDSINLNNQVLDTWDFVSGHTNVNDHSHGMQCLSTIAANIPGEFIGKAPKASFYLYRTEDAPTEYLIEEHNWACGAERADSSGADILSTSLGYTDFDSPLTALSHTYTDLNGNLTIASIAADLAAKKGLLVVASVGNDGNGTWHFLSTPSDGDSVLAVGAVNVSGTVWNGSSYGPSGDGQIKPDVASVGLNAMIQGTGNTTVTGTGTSFAAPNMAGLGTCLWQGFPEVNNMRIVRAIKESGSIFSAPNDRIGYGIPDMKAAFIRLLIEYATANATVNACNVTLNWNSKDVEAMKYEIERKTPADIGYLKVGELNPQAGSILTNRSYQFNNTLLTGSSGNISFRIRQIIDTAAASFADAYLDTVNIVIASGCTPTATTDPNPNADKITVLPNPTQGDASLVVQTVNAIPNMPVMIYDMKGRLVMKLQKSKGPGKATIDLPFNKLSKGKYIINVYNSQRMIGSVELLKL